MMSTSREKADIVFQQKGKNIRPVDISPADRGRKNEAQARPIGRAFNARFGTELFVIPTPEQR